MKNACYLCLLVVLGFTSACAHGNISDKSPVYYTESGVPGEYEELGPVKGSTTGYCASKKGVYRGALEDALTNAIAMGGDGILVPNSIDVSGADMPVTCNMGVQLLMIPGAAGESIQAIAIDIKENASSEGDVEQEANQSVDVHIHEGDESN